MSAVRTCGPRLVQLGMSASGKQDLVPNPPVSGAVASEADQGGYRRAGARSGAFRISYGPTPHRSRCSGGFIHGLLVEVAEVDAHGGALAPVDFVAQRILDPGRGDDVIVQRGHARKRGRNVAALVAEDLEAGDPHLDP